MNPKLLQRAKAKQPSRLVAVGPRLRAFKHEKPLCGVQDLVRLTNLTRAQILNLEKAGLVKPTWRKFTNARAERPEVSYSVQDVLKALIISDLRDKFSLQLIRKAMKNLEAMGLTLDEDTYLLTDGYSIHVAKSDKEVVDILRHNRQMLLLVSVEDQIEKLHGFENAA